MPNAILVRSICEKCKSVTREVRDQKLTELDAWMATQRDSVPEAGRGKFDAFRADLQKFIGVNEFRGGYFIQMDVTYGENKFLTDAFQKLVTLLNA